MKYSKLFVASSILLTLQTNAGVIESQSQSFMAGRCNTTDSDVKDTDDGAAWTVESLSSCEFTDANGLSMTNAYSSVDATSGEIKLSALTNGRTGTVWSTSTAGLGAELYFSPLANDTTITFDLNLEGAISADDDFHSVAGISQSFWYDVDLEYIYPYQVDYYQEFSTDVLGDTEISDLTSLTFDLAAGTSSMTFYISYEVYAIRTNVVHRAEAEFMNTSWLNISIGDGSTFTSDIASLLLNPRPNIGAPVNPPVTSVAEPESFGLFLLSCVLFAVKSRKRTKVS